MGYSFICNEIDFNAGGFFFLTFLLAEVYGRFNELWGLCKDICIAGNSPSEQFCNCWHVDCIWNTCRYPLLTASCENVMVPPLLALLARPNTAVRLGNICSKLCIVGTRDGTSPFILGPRGTYSNTSACQNNFSGD